MSAEPPSNRISPARVPATNNARTWRSWVGNDIQTSGELGVLGGDCRIHAKVILTSLGKRSSTLTATHISASSFDSGGESERTTASHALTTLSEYEDMMESKSSSFEPRRR
jgi:hypothetical protein